MDTKKIICIAMLLITSIVGWNASAQQDSLKGKRDEKLLTPAQKNVLRLGLTSDQKQPFGDIIEKYTKKTLEIKNSTFSREEKLEKVSSLNVEKDAEVRLLLKPEQFKIYKEIVDERRQKMEAARNKEIKIKE